MTLPRLLFLVLLLVAGGVLGVAVVALSEREEARPAAVAAASAAPADGPVAVLRAWDERRAAAWAAGDVAGLRALYTRRSAAGDRDAARLSRWVSRGLRVRDLQIQVLRARVLEERTDVVRLSVTDRIGRAVAIGQGDSLLLPADSPSTWRITMRRSAGEWRVAAIRR